MGLEYVFQTFAGPWSSTINTRPAVAVLCFLPSRVPAVWASRMELPSIENLPDRPRRLETAGRPYHNVAGDDRRIPGEAKHPS